MPAKWFRTKINCLVSKSALRILQTVEILLKLNQKLNHSFLLGKNVGNVVLLGPVHTRLNLIQIKS